VNISAIKTELAHLESQGQGVIARRLAELLKPMMDAVAEYQDATAKRDALAEQRAKLGHAWPDDCRVCVEWARANMAFCEAGERVLEAVK